MIKQRATKRMAGSVDVQLGNRIRTRRMQAGMTQEKLGDAIGVTFQQIQKYEKGTNRVTVAMLLLIADALGESINYFIPAKQPTDEAVGFEKLVASISGMNMLKAFEKLSARKRQVLILMAEAMSDK